MAETAKAKALLRERARRAQFPEAVQQYLARLFPEQQKLLNDPNKRKVVHAGRRAGKTHTLVGMALDACVRFPGATIPIVERTLSCQAAETFWTGLQDIDAEFGLQLKWQHTLRLATCPNGSKIALMGADTAEAADKVLGGKYPLAVVDEAGSYRQSILEYLVLKALEPATMDYDGTIVMAGTPNPLKRGFFWDATQNAGWASHHWTVLDNPNVGPTNLDPVARRAWRVEWLRLLRERNGWSETSAQYVREYLGEWCDLFDDRMYEVGAHNFVDELPAGTWTYILGSDVGIVDPCAFCVWGRRDGDPNLYVVESYEQPKLIPSTYAGHVERLKARYSFAKMVIDAGGQGKAFQQELAQTYGLHMENADKTGKIVAIAAVNGDMKTGRVQILRSANRQLVEDLQSLPWNEDHTDAQPGVPDHTCDAFLYGARAARQWAEAEGMEGERVLTQAELWQAVEDAMMYECEHGFAVDGDPDELTSGDD